MRELSLPKTASETVRTRFFGSHGQRRAVPFRCHVASSYVQTKPGGKLRSVSAEPVRRSPSWGAGKGGCGK